MTEKPKCNPRHCINNFDCDTCPSKWIPREPDCMFSKIHNCEEYESCKDCPGDKEDTWPNKRNINYLLKLSVTEKAMAFDSIVKRYVSAKTPMDMECWIANVLSYYIKKHMEK